MPRPSAGYWVIALSLATQAWQPSSKAERLGLRVPAGLAVRLYWRAARLASPGKGRSPNSLPMGVASTLSVVPPRTAAGSRSDPRLGLGVIYGDFGEAALLMQRTRQQVWCWLIGHDIFRPTLGWSGERSPARPTIIARSS